MECDDCDSKCMYCNSLAATDCIECKVGYFFYENECLEHCPADYLEAPTRKACVKGCPKGKNKI